MMNKRIDVMRLSGKGSLQLSDRFVRISPKANGAVRSNYSIRWVMFYYSNNLIYLELSDNLVHVAVFSVAAERMSSSIESKAAPFKGCTVSPGFMVLFSNQHLYPSLSKITSTYETAYTGSYDHRIIIIAV